MLMKKSDFKAFKKSIADKTIIKTGTSGKPGTPIRLSDKDISRADRLKAQVEDVSEKIKDKLVEEVMDKWALANLYENWEQFNKEFGTGNFGDDMKLLAKIAIEAGYEKGKLEERERKFSTLPEYVQVIKRAEEKGGQDKETDYQRLLNENMQLKKMLRRDKGDAYESVKAEGRQEIIEWFDKNWIIRDDDYKNSKCVWLLIKEKDWKALKGEV